MSRLILTLEVMPGTPIVEAILDGIRISKQLLVSVGISFYDSTLFIRPENSIKDLLLIMKEFLKPKSEKPLVLLHMKQERWVLATTEKDVDTDRTFWRTYEKNTVVQGEIIQGGDVLEIHSLTQ